MSKIDFNDPVNPKPKLCIDCKYFLSGGENSYHIQFDSVCLYYAKDTVDLVSGIKYALNRKNCREMRNGGGGYCGEEGKFFQPKEIKEEKKEPSVPVLKPTVSAWQVLFDYFFKSDMTDDENL